MRSSLNLLLTIPLLLTLNSCQSYWWSDDDSSDMGEYTMVEGDPEMESDAPMEGMSLVQPVDSPLAGWDAYGAPIVSAARLGDAKGFAQLASDPAAFDGKQLRVVGIVEEVCQSKGCWMTFSDQGQMMRVKFLDYAFFMPMDCAGRQAIVDGVFTIEITPVDEARHYLEDAGRYDEAAALTEDVETLNFMASSVLLMQE